MHDLSVKICKENDELERKKSILTYKTHVKSFEDENERIKDEFNQLRKCIVNVNKLLNYNYLNAHIENLHETLRKFRR